MAGSLRVRWSSAAPAILRAVSGVLRIADGDTSGTALMGTYGTRIGATIFFLDACRVSALGSIRSTTVNSALERLGEAEAEIFHPRDFGTYSYVLSDAMKPGIQLAEPDRVQSQKATRR